MTIIPLKHPGKNLHILLQLMFLSIILTGVPGIVAGQEFWGTTVEGGENNLGVIFKTNPDGTALSVQKQFVMTTKVKELSPDNVGILLGTNGNLYGLAQGGKFGQGALFGYDLGTSTYTNFHDFGSSPNDGSVSIGSLTQTSNGMIYGMTFSGGTNGEGTIFEFSPWTGVYHKRYDFDDKQGSYPYGSLLLASNGKLYGTTTSGGIHSNGTIFEFDPNTAIFKNLSSLYYSNTGSEPFGDLIEGAGGKLYLMTNYGGDNYGGVLVEFDLTNLEFDIKANFNAEIGATPSGSLTLVDGKLYGLTNTGGINSGGTLFEYDLSTGVFKKKWDFVQATGASPYGSLALAANGRLYGLTNTGGATNKGVMFEFDPSTGFYTKRIDLNASTGCSPFYGTLTPAGDSKFYGMFGTGGANNTGVIFKYEASVNSLSTIMDFGGALDGSGPPGGLTVTATKLYGVTEKGGKFNGGVIYEIDPATLNFRKTADFNPSTTGSGPVGQMIVASNGKLYGTTFEGGTGNAGTIFEFDPVTGALAAKASFDFGTGISVYGGLIEVSNGKMYGVTASGGLHQGGILYEFDRNTALITKKIDMDYVPTGGSVQGSLTLASNNKLYGLASLGGEMGRGTLFEFDPVTSILVKKVSMWSAGHLVAPRASLVAGSNGKLYGLAALGATSKGSIFEYEPGATTVTSKYNFTFDAFAGVDFFNAKSFYGSLARSNNNNKLYGMANAGGLYDKGFVFEFDPSTSAYRETVVFNGANGSKPWRGALAYAPFNSVVAGDIVSSPGPRIVVHPNPTADNLRISMENIPGNKKIAIYNITGQSIASIETSENEISLDVSAHAPGIYVIRTLTEKSSFSERFVKR